MMGGVDDRDLTDLLAQVLYEQDEEQQYGDHGDLIQWDNLQAVSKGYYLTLAKNVRADQRITILDTATIRHGWGVFNDDLWAAGTDISNYAHGAVPVVVAPNPKPTTT